MTALPVPIETPDVRSVVVPLDGSERAERALLPAAAVVRAYGAHLVLVTTRWGEDAEEPRRYLHALAEHTGLTGVESIVIHDRFAPEAIELVTHETHLPLVCMTTHGRGGLGESLLGSVAESVVRHVKCPVLLVGPRVALHATPGVGDLMVCVDERVASHAVLPVAASWAKVSGNGIDVVRVVAPKTDEIAVRRELAAAADAIRTSAAPASVAVRTTVLHEGRVAHAIADHARTTQAGAIALTTHGRHGVRRVALGSVAMAVVRDAPVPVLVVGPRFDR